MGTPPPLITWYKDDVLLTGDEAGVTFLDDGSLELYNVDAKDTADYRCVATNAAGEVEHTVALHVLSKYNFLIPITELKILKVK